jgi:hypothetical protein
MEHEEFKKYGLEGLELEEWFTKFTESVGIISQEEYSMSKLLELFNKEIPVRLTDACNRIYQTYSLGNDWIDSILIGKTEPQLTKDKKHEFCQYLLDKVLATDSRIQIHDSQGNLQHILIDITGNPKKQQSKLDKVRGLPHPSDRNGENRNANIPKVRKALGIDKHLVLVLSNDRRLLPSYDKLLRELQDFANGRSRTGCLDLREVPEHERFINQPPIETPQQIFDTYYQKVKNQPLADQLNGIAKAALLDGRSSSEVCSILQNHKLFRDYSERGNLKKAAELASNVVDKNYIEYLNLHKAIVIQTSLNLLENENLDQSGFKTYEGKKITIKGSDTQLEILAKDGRGIIFSHTPERTFTKMKRADIKPFVTYMQKLQQQNNPDDPSPEQDRKPGRSR